MSHHLEPLRSVFLDLEPKPRALEATYLWSFLAHNDWTLYHAGSRLTDHQCRVYRWYPVPPREETR